jgi:endonuclease/exonuclease/phosphatase family metal-dependent hydrolase
MSEKVPGIRVITINTGKCDGNYPERVEWLASELQRLAPDVVAMQECFKSDDGALDTAAMVAQALGMNLLWTPARFKCRPTRGGNMCTGWSGMALLAAGHWLESEDVILPCDPVDGERVAQIAVATVEGAVLTVANIHLTHLRGADRLRLQQLTTVLARPLLHDDFGPPRLVCGDFNAALRKGAGLESMLNGIEGVSVVDSFDLGAGHGERSTLPGRPDLCVDFILSVAREPRAHPLFTSSERVLDRTHPITGDLPSDHYGVATTLVLSSNGRTW